jgi:UDP-N-acetylmuramate dehydrogenase
MNIKPNAQLSAYTTFQLGGPCPCLVECATPDELMQTVQKFKKENTPFLLIAGGSNIVVSDHGLDIAVIRYLSPAPLIERLGQEITVSASTLLDDLALFCVDEGLEGLNYATGIPGTVGGAVVGNAGAWGKQVGRRLKVCCHPRYPRQTPKPWDLIILLFLIVIPASKKPVRSLFPLLFH